MSLQSVLSVVLVALLPFAVEGAVTSIALGAFHSCALLTDSKVKCWGWNEFGQLGDGSNSPSFHLTPVEVSGIPNVTNIALGGGHSCVLTGSGDVWCWGRNDYGQVGNGREDGSEQHVPTEVITDAVNIALGFHHSCAVLTDGKVKCWGWNGGGQLGDGTTTDSASPVEVIGIMNATSIALGGYDSWGGHSCAVLTNGKVLCWGNNGNGQLGDGGIIDSSSPAEVENLVNATIVASGSAHTCALLLDGKVKCWGYNIEGSVGDGTNVDRLSPVDVMGITNAKSIAVGAGSVHSCAIIANTKVRCWGWNQDGQLGDGSGSYNSLTPVDVSGIVNATSIALGTSHSCSLLASKQMFCWGLNEYGQVGDGTSFSSIIPVEVVGFVFPSPPPPLLSCTITQYAEAYECMDCPLGSISVGGNTARCYCPENHARVVDAGEAHGYACVACDSGTFRAAGDVVPISANDASTECFARLNHENWGQISKFTSADPDMLRYDQYFGKSVAVHGNNMIVAASANAAESYSFERFSWYSRDPPPSEASFEERISVLIGDSASARDGSVAIASRSSNDAWIVFGSPRSNEAVIYACMNQICYQGKTSSGSNGLTTPTDVAYEGYFGHSVAVHGETMVVGASGMYWNDDGGHSAGGENNKGSAYVFTPASRGDYNIWVLRATLLADDGSKGDHFGRSVAIFGDTIVVGAPGRSTNGNAYVFTRTEAGSPDSNWTLSAKLSSPFSDTQSFGRSVSVDGNHASVGDPLQEKAHVFVRNTPGDFTASDDWSLEATVESDDGENHGYFGLNVVIKNDVLMVAAPGNPTRASNQRGAVLVFSRDQNTNSWERTKEIVSPDTPPGERDEFGRSLAFDGSTLVVGAYCEGNDVKGAAYVFSADGRGVGSDDVSTTAVPVPSSSNTSVAYPPPSSDTAAPVLPNTSVAYPPPSSDTTSVPPESLVFTDYESSASTCFGLSTVAVSVFVAFVGAT